MTGGARQHHKDAINAGLGGLSESAVEKYSQIQLPPSDTYFDSYVQCTTKLEPCLKRWLATASGRDYGAKIACSVGDLPGI